MKLKKYIRRSGTLFHGMSQISISGGLDLSDYKVQTRRDDFDRLGDDWTFIGKDFKKAIDKYDKARHG